jgi:hypothetical protein
MQLIHEMRFMEKQATVRCPFECEGTGYYPTRFRALRISGFTDAS